MPSQRERKISLLVTWEKLFPRSDNRGEALSNSYLYLDRAVGYIGILHLHKYCQISCLLLPI